MTTPGTNLRKAAVLMRCLDAATAAALLAQLSPAEVAAVREAVRRIGAIDPEEQADVLAEFRRASPLASEPAGAGVELALADQFDEQPLIAAAEREPGLASGKRFEFLETAPVASVVSCLRREHAQTVAVVLSHLPPKRAAEVLSALPARLQADTIERLSTLGDMDPESVTVLERELAEWVGARASGRAERGRQRQAIHAILSATDVTSRNGILANLKTYKASLAEEFAPLAPSPAQQVAKLANALPRSRASASRFGASDWERAKPHARAAAVPPLPTRREQPLPILPFDQLIYLDDETLALVLRAIDADTLALALAGSSDELVDRVCHQLPKRVGKAFRRELRRLGPTRLSDVEAAQRAVSQLATQQLATRHPSFAAQHA